MNRIEPFLCGVLFFVPFVLWSRLDFCCSLFEHILCKGSIALPDGKELSCLVSIVHNHGFHICHYAHGLVVRLRRVGKMGS